MALHASKADRSVPINSYRVWFKILPRRLRSISTKTDKPNEMFSTHVFLTIEISKVCDAIRSLTNCGKTCFKEHHWEETLSDKPLLFCKTCCRPV